LIHYHPALDVGPVLFGHREGGIAFAWSLPSDGGGEKGILVHRKEVSGMEEKKEGGLPIWVWIVVIGISAIIVVSFILFLK